MPGFHLYTSNRVEVLAESLAKTVATSRLSPLETEVIVVSSPGVERYVSLALARIHGICANVWFPFPNAFVRQVFCGMFPQQVRERSAFDPDILTWRIFALLRSQAKSDTFGPASGYFAGDDSGVKLHQLSGKIADAFDQYTVFRPEMLSAWERGAHPNDPTEAWQAELWRRIVRGTTDIHRARMREMLAERAPGLAAVAGIPSRVSLFGIPYLSPFHLDIFQALSQCIDINLFALNPCREFWDDIVSEGAMAREAAGQTGPALGDTHYEVGNQLLASLGQHGREFFTQLHRRDCEEHELFAGPVADSILGCIQDDILNLRTAESRPVSGTDRSVQVHSCHSPMREVEVLHDNLLALLDEDLSLSPDDIAVMMPDIDTYSTLVQATFDHTSSSAPRIPYCLADRSPSTYSRIVNDFLAILDTEDSRFSASCILGLLESQAIRAGIGMTEDEVRIVRSRVEATGIRWGVGRADRARAGFPDLVQNTWQQGLDRIFLGYAMSPDDLTLFHGILPLAGVEEADAVVVGKLDPFLARLTTLSQRLDGSRSLSEWAAALVEMVDDFFKPDQQNERHIERLRNTIADLSEQERLAGSAGPVPFAVVRSCLRSHLSVREHGRGFMAGGVTFCTMLPMRTVPFRVICLLGMNDTSFPRTDTSVGFDLIANAPRAGDRSTRKDDRYCFLEALLSARQVFYVSYVGRSIRDNSPMQPSTVVSELTDYIDRSFACPTDGSTRTAHNPLITHHPLSAADTRYFLPRTELFSYSSENLAAARVPRARDTRSALLASGPLHEPEDPAWRELTVDRLCSFFGHPVRYFLQMRLGLSLARLDMTLQDHEPFEIDPLHKYALQQDLLERRVAGPLPENVKESVEAMGVLPAGPDGDRAFNALCQDVERFFQTAHEPLSRLRDPSSTAIDITHSGFHITGEIGLLGAEHLIHSRLAAPKGKDLLRLWIHHVLLNMPARNQLPRTSILIAAGTATRQGYVGYAPLENAQEHLSSLLDIYQQGMCQLLPLFPESSLAYAKAVTGGKPRDEALAGAAACWNGRWNVRGESRDDFLRLVFREEEALTGRFEAIATRVFGPMLDHQGRFQA